MYVTSAFRVCYLSHYRVMLIPYIFKFTVNIIAVMLSFYDFLCVKFLYILVGNTVFDNIALLCTYFDSLCHACISRWIIIYVIGIYNRMVLLKKCTGTTFCTFNSKWSFRGSLQVLESVSWFGQFVTWDYAGSMLMVTRMLILSV